MMEWSRLLSLKRHGDSEKRLRKNQDETRLGFDVDFDRILFSSAFRSLQDKTQVMPMPVNTGSTKGFVHSRLTHSLEVSVVGRSLGRLAGQRLLEKYPELSEKHGYRFNDFGAIVAAAALSHDIGNPPFGHSGEKAIGHYFSEGPGKHYKEQLSPQQYQDLVDFEGNANGFRILTESRPGIPGGLRLSYATLGTFTKYPKASLPKKPNRHIANKKFGVFQNNWADFEEVAVDLGLLKQTDVPGYYRHPLTYLVEAADDICYTIIDFEDGINLGLIPEEYALEYLINLVKDRIDTKKYHQLQNTSDRLAYLRALAINSLVVETVDRFMTEEEQLLNGKLDMALLDKSSYSAQIDDIIKLSVDRMYRSTEVIEKELTGYEVIQELLHRYTEAACLYKDGKGGQYQDLLLSTLPPEFWADNKENTELYTLLMNMSCFVASLSDSAALKRHNLLTARF